jgi:hypothetical protein
VRAVVSPLEDAQTAGAREDAEALVNELQSLQPRPSSRMT